MKLWEIFFILCFLLLQACTQEQQEGTWVKLTGPSGKTISYNIEEILKYEYWNRFSNRERYLSIPSNLFIIDNDSEGNSNEYSGSFDLYTIKKNTALEKIDYFFLYHNNRHRNQGSVTIKDELVELPSGEQVRIIQNIGTDLTLLTPVIKNDLGDVIEYEIHRPYIFTYCFIQTGSGMLIIEFESSLNAYNSYGAQFINFILNNLSISIN